MVVFYIEITSEFPITDYYTMDDYEVDDYDAYEAYPGNDDDVDVDNCDVDNTIYDLNQLYTCNHIDFKKLTPINETKEFSSLQNIKQCCPYHGYLYPDRCEVRQYL